MKARLSILLLISLFISGCGAMPTATLAQSTPTALALQEPTSTVSIVTPTLDTATILVTEPSATPESTMTPETTATIAQIIMEIVSGGQQTALPLPAVCQRPQNWVVYTVQRNDTLSSLGQRTNTNWQQIQSANCLTSTTIFAGQILLLPFIPAPVGITEVVEPPEAPPPGNPRLEVVPGSGPAGTTFIFKIRDFDPFAIITVKIERRTTLISTFTITMDAKGNFDVAWVSPSGLAVGLYSVRPFRPDGTQGMRGTFGIVESYP